MSEDYCNCEEKRGKREYGVKYILRNMDNDWVIYYRTIWGSSKRKEKRLEEKNCWMRGAESKEGVKKTATRM